MSGDYTIIKFGLMQVLLVITMVASGQKKAKLLRSEKVIINNADSELLAKTWASFTDNLQKRDIGVLISMSLPTVYCFNISRIIEGYPKKELYMAADSFFKVVSVNKQLTSVIRDSLCRIAATYFPDRRIANYKLKHGEKLILYDVYYIEYVPVDNKIKNQDYHIFEFLKIKDRFVFFGLSLEWP